MRATKIPRVAIAIAATGTAFTYTLTAKGVLTKYILEIPTLTNNVTTTLSIVDENSVTIFTGAAHARSANYAIPIDVEVDGVYTVTLTLSGVSGGTHTEYLTFFKRPL